MTGCAASYPEGELPARRAWGAINRPVAIALLGIVLSTCSAVTGHAEDKIHAAWEIALTLPRAEPADLTISGDVQCADEIVCFFQSPINFRAHVNVDPIGLQATDRLRLATRCHNDPCIVRVTGLLADVTMHAHSIEFFGVRHLDIGRPDQD